ncbi:MAG: hypothetical protein ACRDGJ_05130, partial [Candidatus Limnocylindria bacterium]
MIVYRHAPPSLPFLWETAAQPAARWHGTGEGPAHYLATSPDAAWAEFLRHEEITDPAELEGIRRTIWAVELELHAESIAEPELPARVLVGGRASHA